MLPGPVTDPDPAMPHGLVLLSRIHPPDLRPFPSLRPRPFPSSQGSDSGFLWYCAFFLSCSPAFSPSQKRTQPALPLLPKCLPRTDRPPHAQVLPGRNLPPAQVFPQMFLLSAQALPQTSLLSVQELPQTSLPSAQVLPQTSLPSAQVLPQTSLPSVQTLPQTILSSVQALPQTILSSVQVLPQTLWPSVEASVQTPPPSFPASVPVLPASLTLFWASCRKLSVYFFPFPSCGFPGRLPPPAPAACSCS